MAYVRPAAVREDLLEHGLDGDFDGSFPYAPHYLEGAGVRIHYVDEGPPDAPPVLFVHGNPTWSYLWRRPISELSARGRRCVAFDHMGFGRSEKPPRMREYSFDRHIENALAVIDTLDLHRITLVVHDWGGPIGLGALLERPDRFAAVVVFNSWAWQLPSYLPPHLREFRTEGLGEILGLAGNLQVEAIPGAMARREDDPLMMAAYRAPFPSYWTRLGPLALMRDIPISPRDGSHARFGQIAERLPRIGVPVRLVWGMRDRVFQAVFIDQWRQLLPDVEVVELADAGHFVPEDAPAQACAAIAGFGVESDVPAAAREGG